MRAVTLGSVHGHVRKRLAHRLGSVVPFIVATAWTTLFRELFTRLVGTHDSLLDHALYAILFTLLAAVFAALTGDDADD